MKTPEEYWNEYGPKHPMERHITISKELFGNFIREVQRDAIADANERIRELEELVVGKQDRIDSLEAKIRNQNLVEDPMDGPIIKYFKEY